MCFGPTAPPVPITIFGEDKDKYKVRELTRLIINEDLEKNVLSFFVSNCLKILKEKGSMCIISFSDKRMGYYGYIYQATNFYYTGIGGQKYDFINEKGNRLHSLTINDLAKIENINQKQYIEKYNIKKIKAIQKYRYLYFIGNKKQKKNMLKHLKLEILPYPKGVNKRYDTGNNLDVQGLLF